MYDLIIAGAGPAGSSAARFAGKMGLDVLLIDKDLFPRYKPVGEAYQKGQSPTWISPLPKTSSRGA